MRSGTRLKKLEKQLRGKPDLSVLSKLQREKVIRERFTNPCYEAVRGQKEWESDDLTKRLRDVFEELGNFLVANPEYWLDVPRDWLQKIAKTLITLNFLAEGIESDLDRKMIKIAYQIAEIEKWDIKTTSEVIKERWIELFFIRVQKANK